MKSRMDETRMASEKLSRRRALKGAALLAAYGVTVSAAEPLGVAAQVPVHQRGEQAGGSATLTLHVTVPKNVNVRTEIERSNVTLALKSTGRVTPSTMHMDLTTAKTRTWLNQVSAGHADGCTCCVRG